MLGLDELAFIETSSSVSSSCKADAALKDNARRSRPFKPPLRIMEAVGVGLSSLSSLDMRFSAAVKVPCDKGDRRTGRATGMDDVDVADTVDARGVTELDEEEERFRLCGSRWGEAAAEDELEELPLPVLPCATVVVGNCGDPVRDRTLGEVTA